MSSPVAAGNTFPSMLHLLQTLFAEVSVQQQKLQLTDALRYKKNSLNFIAFVTIIIHLLHKYNA